MLVEHIVAKPADIDELLCAAVLSVFRSCTVSITNDIISHK